MTAATVTRPTYDELLEAFWAAMHESSRLAMGLTTHARHDAAILRMQGMLRAAADAR